MKKIKLTQGQYALVDDKDFEKLNKLKWCAGKSKNTFYVYKNFPCKDNNGGQKTILMHRFIMNPPDDMFVDHVDHNGLNNTRKNLRICTYSQNAMNRGKSKTNTSGFKCVSFDKHAKKWRARFKANGKDINVGNFNTAEDAYNAYCKICVKYHKEFSNFN